MVPSVEFSRSTAVCSTPCRLIVDPPASGAWNMAVDEMLWQWAAEHAGCCWRFYRWQEPTLSLGYFQPYDDRGRHPASEQCPVVRRISGGGAILHDAELTYSFVLPAAHRLAARRLLLYRAVHAALIEALAELGVEASLCGKAETAAAARPPFLCFQRRRAGDVLVGRVKIAGSAQRRSRGAVLQHGSVLLHRSPAAPELDALGDLAPEAPDDNRLTAAWRETLGRRLGLVFQQRPLTGSERRRASRLVESKYVAPRWTINRGR